MRARVTGPSSAPRTYARSLKGQPHSCTLAPRVKCVVAMMCKRIATAVTCWASPRLSAPTPRHARLRLELIAHRIALRSTQGASCRRLLSGERHVVPSVSRGPISHPTDTRNGHHAQQSRQRESPTAALSHSRAITSLEWAWVELNYRPHAYQACALTT